MTLLREIQDAATRSDASLSDLLRKCLVLAARLGHAELRAWVERELNGYRKDDTLPDYRVLRGVQSRGHFAGGFGAQLKSAPIPLHGIDAAARESLETVCFVDTAAALEDLAASSKGALQSPWPTDCLALFCGEIYSNYQCLDAWKVIPRNFIVGTLDTIRTRVLSFALEIERENPDAGEATPGTLPLPLERVDTLFQTVIQGGTNTIVGPGAQIVQNIHVGQGDLKSLREHLLRQGLSEDDVRALEGALKEDPPPTAANTLGKKTAEWLGKMVTKAASGAWDKATDVAAVVLTEALKRYLGLP